MLINQREFYSQIPSTTSNPTAQHTNLKLTLLVKQEDRKQSEPNPNQKLDFDTSFHITKSCIISPIASIL